MTVSWPSDAVVGIARADDTTFGILHSRFHELWSLRMGTSLEDRPRYTPTTTFETFPFPAGLTPRDTATPPPPTPLPLAGEGSQVIAAAAKRLDDLRANWLNPPEWMDWVRTPEEEAAGFPLRPMAKPGHEAELKKRTLTNLYNARPPGSTTPTASSTPPWPPPTAGPTTRRRCRKRKFSGGCWR
jgi:hypothetical protein